LKFLLVQLRTEIDVPELSEKIETNEKEEELPEKQLIINRALNNNPKYCYLTKYGHEKYLISKIQIQGVIVFKDVKENRVILGCNLFPFYFLLVDDGTDVTRAILWHKDYSEGFSSDKYFVLYFPYF
jgi:hypothetical protein